MGATLVLGSPASWTSSSTTQAQTTSSPQSGSISGHFVILYFCTFCIYVYQNTKYKIQNSCTNNFLSTIGVDIRSLCNFVFLYFLYLCISKYKIQNTKLKHKQLHLHNRGRYQVTHFQYQTS